MKGYDVKVRLDNFKPLHWRDLIIPEAINFRDLDCILKILWDFTGYHLSRFTFKNSEDIIAAELTRFPFPDGELNGEDILIDSYFTSNKKIYWEYDFGDGWSFTIEIKKVVDYDKDYPTLKRFKGDYNLQDDIGGVCGLKNLIKQDSDKLSKFDMEFTQMDLEDFRDSFLFSDF